MQTYQTHDSALYYIYFGTIVCILAGCGGISCSALFVIVIPLSNQPVTRGTSYREYSTVLNV